MLSEIAKQLNVPLYNADVEINGLGLCNRPTVYPSILSYITSSEYLKNALNNPHVRALVISEKQYLQLKPECHDRFSFLISDAPEEDFYRLHKWLYEATDFYEKNDFEPIIGKDCRIHKSVVIENGVVIGDRVTIGPYSIVNRNSRIGNDTHIGCCSVIGSAGFQIFYTREGVPFNAVHVGGTVIGNKVWIGDHVAIGNALFEGNVQIGDHTQINNHCHIAHNCMVGKNSVLAAHSTLLGSSVVENGCWISPQAVVMNRVTVGQQAMVGTHATVKRDVPPGDTVIGSPAVSRKEFIKMRGALKKIME